MSNTENKKKRGRKGAIAITICECGENHVGNQQTGEIAESGFSRKELESSKAWFEEKSCECELVDLSEAAGKEVEEAFVLIIRGGVNAFFEEEKADEMFDEMSSLVWDKKAFMYGRVVNKHARHNLVFFDEDQAPDYENKKGTIISWGKVPLLSAVRESLPDAVGEKAAGLVAEGNYYYDVSKCGIGFHGDKERKRVIAVRLGESIPLEYQWFEGGKPFGERVKLELHHGDMYIMSEKAVGWDWKLKRKPTLRHAAGAPKFLEIKEKKAKKRFPCGGITKKGEKCKVKVGEEGGFCRWHGKK